MLQHSSAAARALAPSTMQAIEFPGAQVLLIEDNAIIAMDIAETLAAVGCAVCAIVGTEAEAIEAAAAHRPDLLIADVSLRQGCGISAVETIVRGRSVPYIFITGDVQRVLERAPSAIAIAKPFAARALISAMRRALAGAEQAEEGRRPPQRLAGRK